MRFLVKFKNVSRKSARVSIDYRSRFISLLKRVFGEEPFRNDLPRPYTFAVFFGKSARIRNGFLEGVDTVNFRFSTGDPIVAVNFYNGLLALKKRNYIHDVGTGRFRIEFIGTEREKVPTGLFRTLSPVIVERMGFSDERNRYITPEEDGFTESLLENIVRKYRSITGKDLSLYEFNFKPVRIKIEPIRHYGGVLRGILGTFRIKTDSQELLSFVYKYGLGLRTGQGFGYLEVEDGEA